MSTIPNPGSPEAIELGCKCPVLDNNHGKFDYGGQEEQWPSGMWWISATCDIHWRKDVTKKHDSEV